MNRLDKSNGNLPLTKEEKERRIKTAAMHYGDFLRALGFNYEVDPNSFNTPMRVAKAWMNDLAKGCFTPPPSITTFPSDGYTGLVFQGNIVVKSLCSHHNLPFTGHAHVSYIPSENGSVIGLSKLNRIVDWYARRPQLQESLTTQIHNEIDRICSNNLGVAVMISAKHTCCSLRGIEHDSTMKTTKMSGVFMQHDKPAYNEFLSYIHTLK